MLGQIAIIGSGAAGLAAAYYLSDDYELFLFEAGSHFGGHAFTYVIEDGPDAGLPLDLGFMVMNSKNYVHFQRLLKKLGLVEYGNSDMSFGYYNPQFDFSYALNWNEHNYFSKKYNLYAFNELKQKPQILPYLSKIHKTCGIIEHDLLQKKMGILTLREYFSLREFPQEVIDLYIIPMGAAIWSTPCLRMLDFPAQNFFHFFLNHGLLNFSDTIQWQYIPGGSQSYVRAIVKRLENKHLKSPVHSILRSPEHITLVLADGETKVFDKVIIATHADQALELLADATPTEIELLSSWIYTTNSATLHSDEQVMPPQMLSWASWNAVVEDEENQFMSLNYHLNRLQGHTQTKKQYFLSLNRRLPIDEKKIILEIDFMHPTYSSKSFEAQNMLRLINGTNRTYFCGNYLGFGFHEDAALSGIEVAQLIQGKKLC